MIASLAVLAVALGLYAPILYYMVLHWSQVEDYSHGFLIVPLALYFAWEREARSAQAAHRAQLVGPPAARAGLADADGRAPRHRAHHHARAFVLTLIGLVLLILGRKVFRILAFPLLFLFLMVPLPQSLVNVVAFPLQLIAADMAVDLLHLLEIPALREGNIIHLANAQLFVAEACSGLRSLMALDHARRRLRLLLPQEHVRAHHHRPLGDSDRDPGELVPGRHHRHPHVPLRPGTPREA